LAVTGTAQDSSEETKTRPNRQEIIDLMVKTAKMPAQQQSAKIDSLWQASSGSPTPRSDFMFCTGLAYLGNYKAQRCVGSAYENGRGVVEDLSEAYAWYAVALDNKAADKPARETIEADKERVKGRLISAYPHPTEDELDDLAKGQKSRIEQYQEDLKSAKK
jgi:TPR repeat protein